MMFAWVQPYDIHHAKSGNIILIVEIGNRPNLSGNVVLIISTFVSVFVNEDN